MPGVYLGSVGLMTWPAAVGEIGQRVPHERVVGVGAVANVDFELLDFDGSVPKLVWSIYTASVVGRPTPLGSDLLVAK